MNAIQTRRLSVFRNTKAILSDLDLDFPSGKWTSVVGPNGAGKSTLLHALAGLLPYTGSVTMGDLELSLVSLRNRARRIAWLEQSSAAPEGLDFGPRVYDIVMLGRLPYQNWLHLPSEGDHAMLEHVMRQTDVWDLRDRFFSQLSGGERQRVLLARMLAVDAEVLLMDEPLANLDPPHQSDWLEWQKTLSSQGKTTVTVLHEIQFALEAEHLILLRGGRLFYQGGSDDPLTHKALIDLFDGRIHLQKLSNHWVTLPR